ncbi:glycoside hydrolase family 3 C-terminal domain-containing protein [Edaphobacter sp. 12200R-103]|uniref:glycoside hydrolase family 3 C-terminal domain-containing protein n=1 Tax=Edaphobacter sp. 12200R-103 TaxID=2703788 RepID=UPI001EE3D0FC|nr:glycoside hydrolase family 3 C-terminal domain-containing protein [Edaphobacter sp. 12200R-103]
MISTVQDGGAVMLEIFGRRMKTLAAAALLLAGTVVCLPARGQAASKPAYQDSSLPMERRVDDLVSRMTLDEKAQQLVNTAPAIPRLGVPAYDFWNEGLHGVARSGYATLFPQAIGMAATFDEPLMNSIGTVISTEARAKYNEAVRHDVHSIYYGLTIWSPNINIFRDPRWGRGQETYGEDPFLTGQLGTAFVKGLQGTDPTYFRAIATPKHFAVHSGPESDRHRFNVHPSPYDLWDTYLPAFRSTIVDGHAYSIMCAYNEVNGEPACASELLLKDILRGDWRFQGFVTSDCGAIDDFFHPNGHHYSPDGEHASVAGIRMGTDTNCGTTYKNLANAVRQGLIREDELDVSLRRLFLARYKLGLFDPPAKVKYASVPFSEDMSPAHTQLALRAAREAMVLLKNENHTLPLSGKAHTIAVIGPNAAELAAIEGNYNAVPKNPVMPVDGIIREFPATKVVYAQGSPYAENAPIVIPRTQFRTGKGSSTEGLKAEYFSNDSFQGKPALVRVDKQINFDWNSASPAAAVDARAFSVRWTGTLQAPAPGDYELTATLAHCYPCNDTENFTIRLDGKELTAFHVGEDKPFRDSATPHIKVHFDDARPHALEVAYSHRAKLFGAGLTLQWVAPVQPLLDQAMLTIKDADVVVAFVGLSPDLEGEEMKVQIPGFAGGDRTDIGLPAAQKNLLEATKKTGKPLVVVLLNGSALAVNWAQQNANAILEAWYPGQAGAQAIAETLSGKNNPAGRLPVTFYRSVDDLPPFTDYSMANRTYRYFRGQPLYGFGYGLSYTSFAYSNVKLNTERLNAGDELTVEADVKNTGKMAGDEVAELYLAPPQNGLLPRHSLEGFQRLHLAPGETKRVQFTLSPRQLSYVDQKGIRAVRSGTYAISVGGSQSGAGEPQASFAIIGEKELPH